MLEQYEFVGKLMGACLRSKETLALFLSPFFWKKLSGESVSWKNDFVTVDSAQVKMLDGIEKLERGDYELKYGAEITWSCNLSDGSLCRLKPSGEKRPVAYEERLEYCAQVRHARLTESDRQVCSNLYFFTENIFPR
jgi:E3 ubiquitin-protein ligase HECTD3